MAEGSVPVRPDIPVHTPQIAVPLRHIEPVAHHEVGRDGEADVAQVELDPLLSEVCSNSVTEPRTINCVPSTFPAWGPDPLLVTFS